MVTPLILVDSARVYIFFSNYSIINLGAGEAEFRKLLRQNDARCANKDGTIGLGIELARQNTVHRESKLMDLFNAGILDAVSVGTFRALEQCDYTNFKDGTLYWWG